MPFFFDCADKGAQENYAVAKVIGASAVLPEYYTAAEIGRAHV